MNRRLVKMYDPKFKEENQGPTRLEYTYNGLDVIASHNIQNGQSEQYYRGANNQTISNARYTDDGLASQDLYYYDALGSVVGITNSSGGANHNYRYSDFGEILPENGNFTSPHNEFTYTGQLWDENTEMYEFYARSFDPIQGVWNRQDDYRGELADPMSLHRYNYVNQSPVNFWDLYGFIDCDGTQGPLSNSGYQLWKQANHCVQKLSLEQIQSVQSYIEWSEQNPFLDQLRNKLLTTSANGNTTVNIKEFTETATLCGAAIAVGVEYGLSGALSEGISYSTLTGFVTNYASLGQSAAGGLTVAGGELGLLSCALDDENCDISQLALSFGAVYGGGLMLQSGVSEANRSGYFYDIQYSSKVQSQMSNPNDKYHSFPQEVEAYARKYGNWEVKNGADGNPYYWLTMSGAYDGKYGVFEFIKDQEGVINHRYFNTN